MHPDDARNAQSPGPASGEEPVDRTAASVAAQYDRFQASLEHLGRERQYLNYGFTVDPGDGYEQRQERLCLEVFDAARVEPDHRLVDVGFGSGEQDFLWARRHAFEHLHGFNISAAQVDWATARAKNEGRTDRLTFTHGAAEELPGLEETSVDRILAVECAFYFRREAFYRRAAEVLRPGGLLVKADISFAAAGVPLTRLREDLGRVGTLGGNRRLWERWFSTLEIRPIHRQVLPGVEQTVREIRRTVPSAGFSAEQEEQWRSMAFWSRLVALGLRTRALRYDLITLERR